MMDARLRWRKKQRRAGRCEHCGKEPLVGKGGYGLRCLQKRRRTMRKLRNLKPWTPGKGGAVPMEHRGKIL